MNLKRVFQENTIPLILANFCKRLETNFNFSSLKIAATLRKVLFSQWLVIIIIITKAQKRDNRQMDGVVLLILTRNLLQVKGDFSERGEKGKKKWRRIRWRAMAAFINGGHQPVRCPRFRLSALAKGGSIFINAWHLDSYFKYTPSEYHEFVFNKSADEWAHRF